MTGLAGRKFWYTVYKYANNTAIIRSRFKAKHEFVEAERMGRYYCVQTGSTYVGTDSAAESKKVVRAFKKEGQAYAVE